MSPATMRAPARGPRAELDERLHHVQRAIESLDVIIEQLYSVCQVAGAAAGGTIDTGTEGFGEHSEDALRDAWKRVTALGVERKALRREVRTLTEALDELERTRPQRLCGVCGGTLDYERTSRTYCSNACKQKAYRRGDSKATPAKKAAAQRRSARRATPWIAE